MVCEFLQNGQCLISSTLAKLPVVIVEGVCETCLKQDNPMGVNPVTCSRAIYVQEQRLGRGRGDAALNKCATQSSDGVGTELAKLFASAQKLGKWFLLGYFFRVDKTKCGCDGLRYELNTLGLIHCTERKAEFVEKIASNYLKSFTQLKILKPALRLVVGCFFSIAIKRHKRNMEVRHVCS